jgi:phage baseplate assembly protein W
MSFNGKKNFSIQDGNLQNTPITTTIERTYSDIDCTFEASPVSGIYKKKDAFAVRQSVKNLLMTNHGELPFRPYYGGNLNDLLFSLSTDLESSDVEDNVRFAIERYEPRARIQTIRSTIRPDYNSIDVTIVFEVINTQKVVTLNVNIARTR